MASNERITFTVYPLWMVFLGQFLSYVALVFGPAAVSSVLSSLLPAGSVLHPVVGLIALPAMYAGMYWMLRRSGSRMQNFIWLVIAMFAFVAFMQGKRALATGDWKEWAGAAVAVLYTVGFAVLAVRGWRQNRADVHNYHAAERQAHVDLQAEAILRAKEMEGQRADANNYQAIDRQAYIEMQAEAILRAKELEEQRKAGG